jgi:hypothetical protein
MNHPMQPIEMASDGVIRFKANAIVKHLLKWASDRGMGMNELGELRFSDADYQQFAQLIGYSVSGYGELNYASDESVREADEIARRLWDETHAQR